MVQEAVGPLSLETRQAYSFDGFGHRVCEKRLWPRYFHLQRMDLYERVVHMRVFSQCDTMNINREAKPPNSVAENEG